MTNLKYTIIKNKKQYYKYCKTLEKLVHSKPIDNAVVDEIDLLTLLIEKWDADHNSFEDVDPIQLLRSLMDDHNLQAKHLVELLCVSKGYVSDILNYKKGL